LNNCRTLSLSVQEVFIKVDENRQKYGVTLNRSPVMANKKQATKRAGQAVKRQERNSTVKSATKSAVKKAIEAVQSKDMGKAKEAYMLAVKALSKAASKGSIPKARASRKISRLTLLAKKILPDSLPIKTSSKK
jgi:small subunit ribosomal protein S20